MRSRADRSLMAGGRFEKTSGAIRRADQGSEKTAALLGILTCSLQPLAYCVARSERSGSLCLQKMKKIFVLVTALFLGSVFAGEAPLQVEQAWIMAVPPGSEETAIFMTLINSGKKPVRIVSGSLAEADRVTPMLTTKEAGRMGMKDMPFLEVAAGGRAVLRPGGDHLMVYGLKKTLKPGSEISLTLQLQSGAPMVLSVPVSRSAPK